MYILFWFRFVIHLDCRIRFVVGLSFRHFIIVLGAFVWLFELWVDTRDNSVDSYDSGLYEVIIIVLWSVV